MRYFVTIAGEDVEVELVAAPNGDGGGEERTLARVWRDGAVVGEHPLALRPVGPAGIGAGAHGSSPVRVAVELDGACHDVLFEDDARGAHVTLDGARHAVVIEDERERAAHRVVADRPKGPHVVASSMPGIVRAVLVQPGQAVAAGQPLVILEAMKMENEMRAEHAGIVREVKVAAGTAVDGGAALLVLDPPANDPASHAR